MAYFKVLRYFFNQDLSVDILFNFQGGGVPSESRYVVLFVVASLNK